MVELDSVASGLGSAALHRPARLSDRVRDVLRRRHYSLRTEQTYLAWMTRFVAYHGRHPDEMDAPEVIAFLTHLAVDLEVSPSTQRQAQSALVFLYRIKRAEAQRSRTLGEPHPHHPEVNRKKRPARLAVDYAGE